MKTFLTLALICTLLPLAASLQCFNCTGQDSKTCQEKETTCPASESECFATALRIAPAHGNSQGLFERGCIEAKFCNNTVSINTGTVSVINAFHCCNSDKCNSKINPVEPLLDTKTNGHRCYFCNGKHCNQKLDCRGSEDRCFQAYGPDGYFTKFAKGCVSKNACHISGSFLSNLLALDSEIEFTCCEGKLCNSARHVAQSTFVLLASLTSIKLFL